MHNKDLRERLAAQEHDRWSRWHRWLVSCSTRNPDGSLTIPPGFVARWDRQAATDYGDLTERERESDLVEADMIVECLGAGAIPGS